MTSTGTRKLMDRAFTGFGMMSIVLMAASLVIILAPIFAKGSGAYVFRATIEHRKVLWNLFEQGDKERLDAEIARTDSARKPVYDMLAAFEADLAAENPPCRRQQPQQ